MTASRRTVLALLVLLLGLATGAILLDVLETVLFAITVAFVLTPVKRWFVRRGLTEWTATLIATFAGFFGVLTVFAPIVVTLYFRRSDLIALVEQVPATVPLSAFGLSTTINMSDVQLLAEQTVRSLALAFAAATPALTIKFALFGILLFALVLNGAEAARAALAPIPPAYRDVAEALTARARETLYAIYVLQIGTSIATLLIAYPLFWLLGYDSAFPLALIAASFQFVPIIGPSVLVVPLALYQIAIGNTAAGLLVGVLGLILIGWLPDVTVRPRLASSTTDLPGSLYFVGFTGGLFTLGPIGVIVGPLIVAVFVEAIELLADEVNPDDLPPELRDESDDDSLTGFDIESDEGGETASRERDEDIDAG